VLGAVQKLRKGARKEAASDWRCRLYAIASPRLLPSHPHREPRQAQRNATQDNAEVTMQEARASALPL
jgi:hypothetical protein